MSKLEKSQLIEIELAVIELLKVAGEKLLEVWDNSLEIRYKGFQDVYTDYDITTENWLREQLALLIPEAGFIVEEGGSDEKTNLNWVIDPIDGTRNFSNRLPLFYSQVALVEQGEPVLAATYNPIGKQMFSGGAKTGLRLNGKILTRGKHRHNLGEGIVDIDFGSNANLDYKIESVKKLAKYCHRIRITSGAYEPYILTGAIDAHVVLDAKETKPVDQYPRMALAWAQGLAYERVKLRSGMEIYLAGDKYIFESIKELLNGES